MNVLFESIDKLDMECVDRVTEWLSWHLSNFEYVWSWKLWSKQLNEDPSAVSQVKRNFVTDLLDKCIRLSSYDAIKAAIPKGLHGFLPEQPQDAEGAPSKTPESEELRRMFVENDTFGINRFISEHKDTPDTVLKALLSLLQEGRVVPFMNNANLIKNSDESSIFNEECVLECLNECNLSLQDLSFAISVLVDAKFASRIAFVKWVFSDAHAKILCRSAAWDIVRKLLDGMVAAEESEDHGMDVDGSESDVSAAVLHILRFILENVNGEVFPDAGSSDGSEKSYFCTTIGEHAIEFVRKYGKYIGSDASELVSQLSCIDERLSDYSN